MLYVKYEINENDVFLFLFPFPYALSEPQIVVGFNFPEENGDFLVNVNVNVDFVDQVFFEDETEIWTKIFKIGHKSLRMIQILIDTKNNKVKTVGKTVMCGFNLKEQKSIEIRDEWREKVGKFEQFCP